MLFISQKSTNIQLNILCHLQTLLQRDLFINREKKYRTKNNKRKEKEGFIKIHCDRPTNKKEIKICSKSSFSQ